MNLEDWKPEKPTPEAPTFATNPEPGPAAAKALPTNIGQGRKVLVVDDNAVVLKGFEFKFRSAGFEVLTALEGSEAVKLAREKRPDLVLVDINFPPTSGMHWDGFIIVQWLHRLEGLDKLPIIVISSSDATKYKPKALAAGALDFFQKPINFPEMMLRIQQVLNPPPQLPGGPVQTGS